MQKLLANKRWLSGPEFLWKAEDEWLNYNIETSIPDDDPEIKEELLTNVVCVDETPYVNVDGIILKLEKTQNSSRIGCST